MWPVLVHYCEACRYDTPVAYSTKVWTQEHTCSHCGFTSQGAALGGTKAGAMNQTQHDELAQLFAQRMNFQQAQEPQPVIEPIIEQAPIPMVSEKQPDSGPIHFISAHYTHTTHIRPASEPSRSPPPPYQAALMPEALAEILRQHSIDPLSLLPSQVDLFTNADYEQRLRLLELWRISPPSYPSSDLNATWRPTSLEQEEAEARSRYEEKMQARELQQQQQQQFQQPQAMDFDTHMPISSPMTPIREPGEAAWPPAARIRAASISASRPQTSNGQSQLHRHAISEQAEPYIIAGYQTESAPQQQQQQHQHQPFLDPVYAAASGLWQAPSYVQTQQQQQSMADQYGAFDQIRNHADWEAMNERLARERFSGLHASSGGDDEMVM